MTERRIAIVLGAGAGERMGGPKALLVVEGEPLASVHARRMREAGCTEVVLVTRTDLVGRLAPLGDLVVASVAPDPAGSLAVALRALSLAADDLLVITPVDAWPARPGTIALLLDAVRAGAGAATPRFGGRGGHPVVARARVFEGFTDAPRPLRDVLAALGAARARLDVDDSSVVVDLDAPADVVAATGTPPRFA